MIKTDKLIICVAPLGSFITKEANPNIPLQPDEIAEEVYRSWNEGACLAQETRPSGKQHYGST